MNVLFHLDKRRTLYVYSKNYLLKYVLYFTALQWQVTTVKLCSFKDLGNRNPCGVLAGTDMWEQSS